MNFMPYADDTIWLLFGLGLALSVGGILAFLMLGISGWAATGFLWTGILVMFCYYLVGTHPPRDAGAKQNAD